jgi:DNA polymerase
MPGTLMHVVAALNKFRQCGATLSVNGATLDWEAGREPTNREAAWITKHRSELIRELAVVRLDFETASPLDLGSAGDFVYAADPRTVVLLLAWCIGMGDVQVWRPGNPMPDALRQAVGTGAVLVSHGPFDRIIWHEKLVPLGWSAVPLEQWSDTSARARAYRVPASLEKAALRLVLRHQKSGEGKALIKRAAAAIQGKEPPPTIDEMNSFDRYAAQDVETLRELDRRLPELSVLEKRVWLLDAKINARGLPLDLDTVRRLHAVLVTEDARLTARMQELCKLNPKQVQRLLAKLKETAVDPPANLRAETLATWLHDDIFGGPIRDIVETRQQYANSSGTKLERMLASTSADGRARSCFLWHGSHTGRWSGRGFQPQNLPRSPKDLDVDATLTGLLREAGPIEHKLLKFSRSELSIKARIVAVLRAMIKAPAGQRLVVADFSQIESRVLCWLAEQQKMLDLYRRGKDPYIATANELGSNDRRFGKLLVLAAGFGGGPSMLMEKAPSYGVPLSTAEAEAAITDWRAANPEIVRFWNTLHDTVRTVSGERVGFSQQTYRLTVSHDADDTLRIHLPSGRALIYHQPRIELGEDDWSFGAVVYQQPLGRDWVEKTAWRGLITENIVQAVAYDVMADAMLRMDTAGIELIGTVHDEAIAIAPEDKADTVRAEMVQIMSAPPAWASGLPLAAEGYHNERYVKP